MKADIFTLLCIHAITVSAFYSPDPGRWTTRDPLGEADTPNLYAFVRNNPVDNVDPNGMYTLIDAEKSLKRQRVRGLRWSILNGENYTDEQLYDEWLRLERTRGAWWTVLPRCPSKLCIRADGTPVNPAPAKWRNPDGPNLQLRYHPGGQYEMRSHPVGHLGNQCIYDASGDLMVKIPSAGTVDFYAPGFLGLWYIDVPWGHYPHDVVTYELADSLGRIRDYYSVRPSW